MKTFPDGCVFTSKYVFHPGLSQEMRKKYSNVPSESKNKFVSIKKITSNDHPAKGGYGLYAKQTLKPRQFVIHYIGQVIAEENSDDDSEYSMRLESGILCDATHFGNKARFINHYHGIEKAPNCKFHRYKDEKTGVIRVGVYVLKRKIRKGQEILVNYGRNFHL